MIGNAQVALWQPTLLASIAPDISQLLSAQQLNVIQQANASDYYEIKTFVKEVDGHHKSVVLAGEYHKKDLPEHEISQRLVAQFRFYGFEGSRPRIWSRLSKISFDLMKKSKILPTKEYDSSIDDAIESADKRSQEELQRIDKAAEAGTKFETKGGGTFVLFKPGTQLPPLLHLREVHLEQDHETTFYEHLHDIRELAIDVTFITSTALLVAIQFDLDLFLIPLIVSCSVFASLLLHSAIGRYLERRGYDGSTCRLLESGSWLINDRDITISRNIDQAVLDESRHKTMLAIVGTTHVPGISRHLVETYGFSEVPLLAPQS